MAILAHLPPARSGVMTSPADRTQVIDWCFGSRSERAAYAHLRTALQPGTQIVTTSPRLNRGSLAGYDVLILTQLTGEPLDADELAVVDEFIQRGGALFAFYNTAPRELARIFAATFGTATAHTGVGRLPTSPISVGPGGALLPTTEVPIGAAWAFEWLGPNGTPILESDGGDGKDDLTVVVTVGACFQHGKGRAIVIGDEELFSSVGSPGLASARTSALSTSLFRNAVAWLTRQSVVESR